jgi:hypothetical protein
MMMLELYKKLSVFKKALIILGAISVCVVAFASSILYWL